MKNSKTQFVALLLSTLFLLTRAYGQITPLGDAFTNSAAPNTNYGANPLLEVDGATGLESTYIQFPVSSIPNGASIAQATLKIYVNSVSAAGSFDVYYVTGTWSESTITASSAPAPGASIVSNVPVTTADKNQYILVDITPAVIAWLSGSQPNYGIALVPTTTFNASFDSKENTTTSHPPELDIVFSGDGSVTNVATGPGLTGGPITGSGTISLIPCASGQVLQWNGTTWACASVAGTGTVTSVGSGPGLTGGPITGTGTLSIATGGVTSAMLANSYAQLNTANTFTGNQTVTGNLTATGAVQGNNFQIGGLLFGFGSSGIGNAFLGFAGNLSVTGTSNTGTGYKVLHADTTGSGNTATGYEALALNTTGSANTASGSQALTANTTGLNNDAVGAYALFSNTTGGNNTAVGDSALYSNNAGNANNAIGFKALYSNTSGIDNDATGDSALYFNTSGGGNEASGEGALYSNTTGNHNAALGFNALYSNTTGSNNTALGYSSGTDTSAPGLANATAIGAWADVAESNAVVLGSILNVNGCLTSNPIPCQSASVGIGTTTPQATLDVEGTTPSVIFGSASNPASFTVNGGANFSGGTVTIANLNVTGTLSKPAGTFKIDHPLDPAHKYLYHSFVESPDMMNVYNGNINTDDSGLATVTLPDWFEALNQDFRYQLTVIGRFAQAIVASEISRNQFTIRTDKPNVKVSWQVTGIRHDAYADAHRIQVEEDKPPQEQGHYLHPELFGAGPEQAVGYQAPTVMQH